MRRVLLGLSLFVLVLGGCLGMAGETSPDPTNASEPSVPEENVWGKETLTVAVNDSAAEVDVTPLVEDALTWWEGNASRYAGYPISFDIERDAEDPDIRIDFVQDVKNCTETAVVVGCASNMTDATGDQAVRVQAEAGFVDANTRKILKHEIGHALGLSHGQGPDLMDPNLGKMVHRDILIQVLVSPQEDLVAVTDQFLSATETWEQHFKDEFGYDVTIWVEVVSPVGDPEFSDDTNLAYNVTSDRDACGGNATCIDHNPEHADARVTTANIYTDQHEYTFGAYIGHLYNLRVEEFPEEYQSMD